MLLVLVLAGALALTVPTQAQSRARPQRPAALDLFVTSRDTSSILRYDGTSGAFIDAFVPSGSGGINRTYGLRFAPDGSLLASSSATHEIKRYDGATGAFLNNFVPAGGGGLQGPAGLIFGPDGNLYAASLDNNQVIRYNGTTGAYIDTFIPAGSGGLYGPTNMVFGPDGNFYVASVNSRTVLKYDGTTGAFLSVFVSAYSGGLDAPEDLAFGPDGNLYVTSYYTSSVKRYNGTTGAYLGDFVPAGSGGLSRAWGLLFGPDGNLYVTSYLGNAVQRYNGTTGAYIDTFIPVGSGGLVGPFFLLFHDMPVSPTPTATPQVSVTATATPQGVRRLPANVCVALWQDPDKAVAPGEIFTYTLRVQNTGPGTAYSTGVRMDLDPNVEVLDFRSPDSRIYVDYVDDSAVSVRFQNLSSGSGTHAEIIARVRPGAAAGTVIISQATGFWDDTRIHRTSRSNTVTLKVGPTENAHTHGLRQPLRVTPEGPVAAGTTLTFRGDFFCQEEAISFWLNLPGGDVVVPAVATGRSNMAGIMVKELDTTVLAPGTYTLVAHGWCSTVEGIGTFTIR
jgi:streptogramin lyase